MKINLNMPDNRKGAVDGDKNLPRDIIETEKRAVAANAATFFVQQIVFSSKIDYNWTKREMLDERSFNEIV